MNRLTGKVAMITGAASGIGKATATRFAAEGARVVLMDLSREPLEALARDLDGVAVAGDAAVPASAERCVAAAAERFGGLDVLVTCAGADVGRGALVDLTPEGWDDGMRANLHSCMVAVRAALPALIAGKGAVVVMSSIGALAGAAQTVTYQTAKAGLLGLVRSVALDYGPVGVRINAICPGPVRTPMYDELMRSVAAADGISLEEASARATSLLPLKRAADPSEIASVALFLASSDASFVTGTLVNPDGGAMALNSGTVAFAPVPAS